MLFSKNNTSFNLKARTGSAFLTPFDLTVVVEVWVEERQTDRRINERDGGTPTLTARLVSCLRLQAADSRPSVIRAEDAGAGVGLLVPQLPSTHHHRSRTVSVRRQRPGTVR